MGSSLLVGLTGGIASGKSTVSERLAEHGAVVIDADLLARQALEPGSEGLAEVVKTFGEDLLDADGGLDRPALGAIVFNDAHAREKLNAIVHPRVREAAAALREAASPGSVVVEDIPLLVETGQAGRFDAVVVVQAPREERVRRIVENRKTSREDAESRIAAQATDEERAAVADYLIDNNGTREDLRHQVDELWERLQARLGS